MTRRNKPKSPEAIAADKLAARRRDFEAANLPDSAELQTAYDVEVRREGQKNVLTARRTDVFDLLKPGMAPGAYDAARRLERDMRIRAGETERGSPMPRVDALPADVARALRMAAAGQRVDHIMGRLPIRDALVLRCLIEPIRDATWHASIERLTGETHPHAHGAVVRGVCLNLRDTYTAMERRKVA